MTGLNAFVGADQKDNLVFRDLPIYNRLIAEHQIIFLVRTYRYHNYLFNTKIQCYC